MANKFIAFAILFGLFHFNVSAQKRNPLKKTKWQFSGYMYKSENNRIRSIPDWVVYTLEFHKNNRLSGKAGPQYTGRYKLKGCYKVDLYPNISKASDPNYPTQEEFNYREEFVHALGSKGPYLFLLKDDQLHIYIEENIVMLFKRI